jgi:hypothetical protein
MSWEGEQSQPEAEQPSPGVDDRPHEGVPTADAVVEEWERAVSEAMNAVREALKLAHERIQSLSDDKGVLQARLDKIAAVFHDDDSEGHT